MVSTKTQQAKSKKSAQKNFLDKQERKILRLIQNGDNRKALKEAKNLYRQKGCGHSEKILIEAYVARIRHLFEKGLTKEAESLIDLTRQRHPASQAHLDALNTTLSLEETNVDELLKKLAAPDLDQETEALINRQLKQRICDPAVIARSPSLPEAHPLKRAAEAVSKAFSEVTSGKTDPAALTLPQISRRSPLAPWKFFIRAVACFYSDDHDSCSRHLALIDPESAPARLCTVFKHLLDAPTPPPLSKAQQKLADSIRGPAAALAGHLEALDKAFAKNNKKRTAAAIKNATRFCKERTPELLQQIKNMISVHCRNAGIPFETMVEFTGEPFTPDADYFRLHACLAEKDYDFEFGVNALVLWEQFRIHALKEKLFPEGSPEEAALLMHMHSIISKIGEETRNDLMFLLSIPVDSWEYEEMEDRIFATSIEGESGWNNYFALPPPQDLFFLLPEKLLERVCSISPASETFSKWFDIVHTQKKQKKQARNVAEKWHSAIPRDTAPLLFLMEQAEERNALKKALQYLEKAEAIDRVNPEVQQARFRILAASLARHLKNHKLHLAAREFEQLDDFPAARQGLRPVYIAALHYTAATMEGDSTRAQHHRTFVQKHFETGYAADMVLLSVARHCSVKSPLWDTLREPAAVSPNGDTVKAFATACRLAQDVRFPHLYHKSEKFNDIMASELLLPDVRYNAQKLYHLAGFFLGIQNEELLYITSGIGLKQEGPLQAQFLFLRYQSMDPVIDEESSRLYKCLLAALKLARNIEDTLLQRTIADELTRNYCMYIEEVENELTALSPPSVIKAELKETTIEGWQKVYIK